MKHILTVFSRNNRVHENKILGSIKIRNSKTGRLIYSIEDEEYGTLANASYSADGKYIVAAFGDYYGFFYKKIVLFNSDTGSYVQHFNANIYNNTVGSKLLKYCIFEDLIILPVEVSTITIWNIKSGKIIDTIYPLLMNTINTNLKDIDSDLNPHDLMVLKQNGAKIE